MTTTLIRRLGGREIPAPGRWIIAPGFPVAVRSGWRRRSGTGRIAAGSLFVSAVGTMSLRLSIDTTSMPWMRCRTLQYQSMSIAAGSGRDVWLVEGQVVTARRILPARGRLVYHGVFRSPLGLQQQTSAIARLGWFLRFRQSGAATGDPRRLDLSADLSAHAPQFLPKDPDDHR